MASSRIDISNLALGWLGGNLIISFEDGTVESNLCAANFVSSRDAALEDRDWSFAQQRRILAPKSSAPAFGYEYEFTQPENCIRVIAASANGEFTDRIKWEKEGTSILANYDTLYIKYIAQIEDETKFSKGFIQACAARLAMDIAIPLTNSPELQAQMSQLYNVKLERAGTMDNMQGRQQLLRTSALIDVR